VSETYLDGTVSKYFLLTFPEADIYSFPGNSVETFDHCLCSH